MPPQRRVCGQCKSFDEGKVDPSNLQFYCHQCWASYGTKGDQPPAPQPQQDGQAAAASTETAAAPQKQQLPPPQPPAPQFQQPRAKPNAYSAAKQPDNLSAASPMDAPILALKKICDCGPRIAFDATRRQLLLTQWADGGEREPSLLHRVVLPIHPTVTVTHSGNLSPRSANGGTGRYRSHVATEQKLPLDALLSSVDDIVSQIYVCFDEAMTKIILNSLDHICACETVDQQTRTKMRVVDELVQSLGDGHYVLIQCLTAKPRDVFLRLLEEFCDPALLAEAPGSSAAAAGTSSSSNGGRGTLGASVRFVFAGKASRAAAAEHMTADERWLKHMQKRYKLLTEESELDAMLRKDFSLSSASVPSNTIVRRHEKHVYFHVPPPERKLLPQEKRVCIETELPQWTHPAFVGLTHLNTIQTEVFQSAFHTSQNMMICAPTGAGKTYVALLVMLRLVSEHFANGKLDRDFKMIFIAPMKALAQEMVTNFSKRLAPFMLVVKELTGDMQLTKKEISQTQLIVTTPEKWDVVTRKQSDTDLVRLTKLIIIDEIHLLNDERGPVLEAIVARTLRTEEMDSANKHVRLVGLSATLPNYKDVANFLNVDLQQGLKVFGPEYRPVPLEQSFLGTYDTSRGKEAQLDKLCFDEVVRNLRDGHQVMVFVHARKQTHSFGAYLVDEAKRRELIHLFRHPDMSKNEVKAGGTLQGKGLSGLFMDGVCCHHAGLVRYDRTTIENLYRDGSFKVLVCTSTLAWGVNLPAHTVIIRGTEVYDPKRGGFVSISVLDVLQIFGRAGRPQYDTSGHGIIISDVNQVNQYLRLIAHALPIESKLQSKLCDHLNAEVHAGTISSVAEGVRWLEYTYLWQRIRVNPLVYGLKIQDVRRDPNLREARYGIIATAAAALAEANMVRFNPTSGSIDTTDLGRIASHYYVQHESIRTFNEKMRNSDETMVDTLDLGTALNVIACANEFGQLRARQDELDELNKIHNMLPKSVQRARIAGESADETSIQWKVTTLIKAFISRVPLDMHSLVADTHYIEQNAARLCRALFEIEVQRGHPHTSNTFLTICKCLERRAWPFQHPLLQFEVDFTDSVMFHLNDRNPRMTILQEMNEKEIGSLVHNARFGGVIAGLVRCFPTVEIDAIVQPITRTILRVKVTLKPAFEWNVRFHGGAEHFWLFVEDQDNNFIFHQEMVVMKKKDVMDGTPTVVNLTIPVVPEYDLYSIRIYSDKWLGSEEEFTFSVGHLHLPDEAPPTTKLLPMAPLGLDVIPKGFHGIYQDNFTQLNALQTQTFHAMFHTDSNIFLGAPTGSGKTIIAEMAMLRVLLAAKDAKIVYIAPLKALVKERMKDWGSRFDRKLGIKVVELSGDVTPDISALVEAQILCTTPEKWDGISRSWQVRNYVQQVHLVIFDEVHMLGSDRGPILEVIVSRMRYVGWHTGKAIRLVGLSTAVANPGDLAAWLGVDKKWALFNFEPSVRPVPMRVHIAGYPGRHYCPRMATMNKPTYNAIIEKSPAKPVIVFVSSRRQTRLTAVALISFLMVEDNTAKFVRMTVDELHHTTQLIQDPYLKHCVQFGIAIHHAGLAEGDKAVVEDSFRCGRIQILVATSTLAWGVNFPAHLVVVKGTEFYDGKTKSYVDYPITDVLQMIGRAGRPQFDTEGVAQVLCHEPKKAFYRKFLYDPFPVESSLHKQLHVHINAEIVAGTIATRQDAVDYLTWTYLFRRLAKNPSYYGLEEPSAKALTLFLTNTIKAVLVDLEAAGCIEPPSEAEDDDPNALRHTVLGKLTSYYYMSHLTAKAFDANVLPSLSHQQLLKVMCEAQEFAELPVRHNEDKLNLELAARVPLAIDGRFADSPHVKAFLLFQAHFERAKLPISDYFTDQKSAMDNSVRLIQAMVDIAANNGHLFASLRCMTLMQCIVQGRWWHDSTLLQLPHVEAAMLPALEKVGVTHIAHLANATLRTMDQLKAVLLHDDFGLGAEHVDEVLSAVRRLPLVDIAISIERKAGSDDTDDADAATSFEITVAMTRLSVPTKFVSAPKFAKQKDEQYWVAIGCELTGELLALKRVNRLWKKGAARLKIDWDSDWDEDCGTPQAVAALQRLRGGNIGPRPSQQATPPPQKSLPVQVYVVCDSYLGLDQQYSIELVK